MYPGSRLFLLAAVATLASAACDDRPTELTLQAVTSGRIGDVAFTVTGGTVFQAVPGGPIFADESGGEVVLDADPAALGMTNPSHVQLRTRFALSDSGSIQIAGYGDAGSELSSGHWVVVQRLEGDFQYQFRLRGSLFAEGSFSPPPNIPSAEQWVVTEFYAQDAPGYNGRSGITMWPINNLTPVFAQDVLGCSPGPALETGSLSGDAVAYALRDAWLLVVQPVTQIVGPCE